MQKFTVEFSAEEVTQRTSVVDGDPPKLVLVTGKVPVDGKDPYAPLLCKKLEEAVPSHSKFHIEFGMRDLAKGSIRACYVMCSHSIKHQVMYVKSGLVAGNSLSWTINVKCVQCLGHPAPQQQAADPELQPEDPPTLHQLPTINFIAATPATAAIYKAAIEGLNAVMTKSYGECLASGNQQRSIDEGSAQLEDDLVAAWRNARNRFAPRDPTPPPRDPTPPPRGTTPPPRGTTPPPRGTTPPPRDPITPVQTGANDFNNKLRKASKKFEQESQAAKRIREAKEAKAAKRVQETKTAKGAKRHKPKQ